MFLALGAALCFGMVYVFVDRGAIRGDASPLWVIGGERLASVALLLAFAIRRREVQLSNRYPGRIMTVGLLDTAANVLFAFATRHGNLGVVSMLASTFPVVTVLLGWFVLGERLTRLQQGGVLLALVGVALLSSG